MLESLRVPAGARLTHELTWWDTTATRSVQGAGANSEGGAVIRSYRVQRSVMVRGRDRPDVLPLPDGSNATGHQRTPDWMTTLLDMYSMVTWVANHPTRSTRGGGAASHDSMVRRMANHPTRFTRERGDAGTYSSNRSLLSVAGRSTLNVNVR
ncbi:MAG: hypothetical protein U5K74_05420 [Gemmatimonadaceae bacterium]|nr:hypothetical protein [Gemmatimonadaceae bacterium]